MKIPVLIAIAAAAPLVFAADDASPRTPSTLSPVLRSLEPADSGVFALPAPRLVVPPLVIPASRLVKVTPPVPLSSLMPAPVVLPSLPGLPSIQPKPAAGAKPASSGEVGEEVAFSCQKRIGKWTEADARGVLGAPLRTRTAFDEQKHSNGKIYAYKDPTGRYRELELDFDSKSGTLRTIFAYPRKLTLQEVRNRWHGEVSAADAPEGRKFYSYTNRRLDVLVDSTGKVISLGLY